MKAGSLRRAVIPANGIGTRLLPATKAVPKEMLPLVDRPLIQYAVEEALEAGIEEILIVTAHGNVVIEDHFDRAPKLADALRQSGHQQALEMVEGNVIRPGALAYIRQQQPAGLGHALWCARHVIANEPFAVLLPEDVFQTKPCCLAQMIAAYPRIGGNFAAVAPFRHDHAARHGVLAAAHDGDRLLAVTRLATQPTPGDPTMKWTAVGRFILDPAFIERLRPSSAVAGEIELVDGLAAAAADGALSGYAFTGRHFDCSSTLGLFEANIAFTLARPDLGAAARNLLTFHVHRGDMPAVAHSIATPDLAASA